MIFAMQPRLRLLGAALLFSTGGAAIKLCGLSGWQIAGLRSGIAAAAMALFIPGAWKPKSLRPLLVGAAYAVTLLLFVLANKLTTAANTIFLQSTAPIYVVLLSPWLLKERLRKSDLLLLGVMAAGMALFFIGLPAPQKTAPSPRHGDLLALAAGVGWAATLMGLRWMERTEGRSEGGTAVLWGNAFAFIAAAPFYGGVLSTAPSDWAVLVYLGIFQIGLAYVLLTQAFRKLQAAEASLLMLIEPVLNPVWTWFVHGETIAILPLCGCALILIATLIRTLHLSTTASDPEN